MSYDVLLIESKLLYVTYTVINFIDTLNHQCAKIQF